MADNKFQENNIFSENDALDINELASLNEDITPEFIEKLQNKVSKTAEKLNQRESTPKQEPVASDDSTLFEEVSNEQPPEEGTEEEQKPEDNSNTINVEDAAPPQKAEVETNIDDNFIKKYKAKLNKQEEAAAQALAEQQKNEEKEKKASATAPKEAVAKENKEIENLTGGNITEKPLTGGQSGYDDSLDYLDGNVKYTKYVIYVNPENKDFMDSLTVKERKNLINRILREQDDIAITKRRLGIVQTIIKHSIIALITIAIAVPVIYITINASLEATINNYRRSQSIFQTLYKEHGKIKTKTNSR